MDYSEFGRKRAEFIIGRGHKRIAYAGGYWFARHTGFSAALKRGEYLSMKIAVCPPRTK
jgi:hypothetical protein